MFIHERINQLEEISIHFIIKQRIPHKIVLLS